MPSAHSSEYRTLEKVFIFGALLFISVGIVKAEVGSDFNPKISSMGPEEQRLAEEYRRHLDESSKSNHSPVSTQQINNAVFSTGPDCGAFGNIAYLVNTDPSNGYLVEIQRRERIGTQTRWETFTVENGPSGQITLGCSGQVSAIPQQFISYFILNETPL